MYALVGAIIDAALSGTTGALYASDGSSVALGGSIFCGLMVFVQLAMYVVPRER